MVTLVASGTQAWHHAAFCRRQKAALASWMRSASSAGRPPSEESWLPMH